jgi:hypothetical protein
MVGLKITYKPPVKGVGPTNLLFPQLTSQNPIFGPKLLEEMGFPKRQSPFLNVV